MKNPITEMQKNVDEMIKINKEYTEKLNESIYIMEYLLAGIKRMDERDSKRGSK
ncbi:hypothetical protein H4O14_16765 [Bacillus sp. PAMC26568]|nr:hypothetical protein H4O14_16765 [Bacillus sp. PAMC26568]